MLEVINGEELNVPIFSWCSDLENGALVQATNLARLPFIFKHLSLMPDSHQGFGMPIGGVLATKNVIIPNAVGVDIGCGMSAMKTSINISELSTDRLKNIMSNIRKVIPLGKNHNTEAATEIDMPRMPSYWFSDNAYIGQQEYNSSTKQLGSLGSGNHFIEIQKESNGDVWIMIHSGSRNIGKKVADHYNNIAIKMNEKYYSSVPKEWELAFLPLETIEARDYIREMNYCIEFAFCNRLLMMKRIIACFQKEFNLSGAEILGKYSFETHPDNGIINIAHNYARMENHFGENVLVHRKGATSAKEGEIGIIPGSQGSCSYIVRGKGNRDSFESCSHGAGRKMGRKQAERTLDLETEQKILNDKGIIHSIRSTADLDEATGAYKNIDEVMNNQKDLVDILVKLEPIAVIKG